MRFYDLILADSAGNVFKPTNDGLGFKKSAGGSTFTSWVNGKNNPGALHIDFDVPAAPLNQAQGSAKIAVYGVGLGMIGQASDLNGQTLTLSAGMKPGLPLATAAAAQSGLILQGTIFQAFGNWQGTTQTLELVVSPPASQQDLKPIPSILWPAKQPLATALFSTLQQAFAKFGMKANVNIANITQPVDGSHQYSTLSQLSDYIQQKSQELGKPSYDTPDKEYSGVQIKIVGNTIYAYDNQATASPKQLAFTDLIGQPTWISPGTVSFKTVLRSDIALGDYIQFPAKGLVAPYVLTSQAAAYPNTPARSKTAFQGQFWVTRVQHFASFRQPDADAWCTSFEAAALSP